MNLTLSQVHGCLGEEPQWLPIKLCKTVLVWHTLNNMDFNCLQMVRLNPLPQYLFVTTGCLINLLIIYLCSWLLACSDNMVARKWILIGPYKKTWVKYSWLYITVQIHKKEPSEYVQHSHKQLNDWQNIGSLIATSKQNGTLTGGVQPSLLTIWPDMCIECIVVFYALVYIQWVVLMTKACTVYINGSSELNLRSSCSLDGVAKEEATCKSKDTKEEFMDILAGLY